MKWIAALRGEMSHMKKLIFLLPFAAYALFACAPQAETREPLKARYTGVNLATGQVGTYPKKGRYGFDYLYPDAEVAAPFIKAGMTAVRVPFRWERVQPVPGGKLDKAEMALLDRSVAALAPFDLIILDLHNYGGFARTKLGEPELPLSAFTDVWMRLAEHYKGNRRIAFGLMNEPIKVPPLLWRQAAEQALRTIRGTGARNLVLVSGTGWSGASRWGSGGGTSNAALFADFTDPGNNFAFEMHQYLDRNSSGTTMDCVNAETAADSLRNATNWLREHSFRGFLGEFGSPPDAQCLASLDALLDVIDKSPDVWMGWTYWAGGAWWGTYPMSIQPVNGKNLPQMEILRSHLVPSQDAAF